MQPLEVPIASVLFLALLAGSLLRYVRERDPVTGMVALVFGSAALVFIGRLLDLLLDMTLPPIMLQVSVVSLLAQPLLTLGLAGLLHRVPRLVLVLASVGYAVMVVGFLALPQPPPVPIVLLIVGIYAATAFAAAAYFFAAARRRIGSARVRLVVAGGATILMAITLLVAGAGSAVPGGSPLIAQLGRYGVLLAAVGYAVAFLTPRWLRRLWQARTSFDLSRRLLDESAQADAAATWRRFAELAAMATGATAAAVLVGPPDGGARLVAAVGDTTDRHSTAWDTAAFRSLLAQTAGKAQLAIRHGSAPLRDLVADGGARFVTLVRFDAMREETGVLVLGSERRSLFADDDRDVLQVLGVEAALLADRARAAAEQAQLAERLSATVEALRDASKAKSDFLASMSHELRTPLNAVLGFSDLMRGEPGAEGRRSVPEEWIEHIHTAGGHLLDLINDVLDLAKVEAGRLELRPEPVDPAGAVAEAMAGLRPLAERKRLRVSASVGLPRLIADRGRLRQILYNLLSNAIKYTPVGGEVRIEGALDGSEARIAVVDTGVGISPEDQDRVFEEFTQVGDPEARQAGTGLGLALTRRLVEAHGGRIELESAVGAGSRFTIVMPLASELVQGPAAPSGPVPAAPPEQVPAPATTPSVDAGQRPATAQPQRVLVIEDDPRAVALVREYLEPDGYAVVDTADGVAGIAAARRDRPAAILLDVLLPGLDGWDVLRRLKADPDLAGIPVLMITVVDQREVGLALGAIDYMVKPIERNSLLATLRRHLPPPVEGRRRRVLAADDDEVARQLVRATLESEGCDVVLAGGGREAVYAAREGTFDLIICDLVMPDLDGFEVVAQLKAADSTRDTPILILTGQPLDERDKARLNGKIIGICEKGRDAGDHLRGWLAKVSSGGQAPPTTAPGST
jgi:signal transduction histidine kinase/DNA-binding response OmpR family regulator